MSEKERKPPTKITIGSTHGRIKVLGFSDRQREKGPKNYRVQCLRCGKIYDSPAQPFLLYPDGCSECREKDRRREHLARYEKYVGKDFGSLTVLSVAGTKKEGKKGNLVYAHCLCHKCGQESNIAFHRLLYDGVKECQACAKKNLSLGWKFTTETVKGGSRPSDLVRSTVNRNSSTGIKGVSRMKSGQYRAYINFRRKQYHLGSYDTPDEAAKARKEAEEKIYGEFLEWYQKEYPDLWERVEQASKNRQK